MRVQGYQLPGVEGAVSSHLLRCGAVEVDVPQLTAAQLGAALRRARRRAHQRMRPRSVDDLLAVVDRVVATWLQPDSPQRRRAEALLPQATGFSTAMVRHGLPLLLEPLRAEPMRALLMAELRDYRCLDRLCAGRHAAGPPLICHVLSGNIPGLAAAPILLSLLLKSAVLVKSAAGDPIFPALLAQSIVEVDPELAACLLVTYWRGGDRDIEAVALESADVVVASGSDAAIAALASRARGRFIGHGHKVSFAVIGRECLHDTRSADALAQRLAYDVCLWDQQGCLSPQLCYVEAGGAVAPQEFAAHLAAALSDYALTLPPRQLGFAEQTEVLRFRQRAEWRPGTALGLLASPDSTAWSISLEEDAEFVPTCLNRCLRIKMVRELSQLAATLAPHRRHLEAAGVAVDASRVGALGTMLAGCGVHRICPLGEMQRPPLSWQQSGRPRVADWVEWTVVEGG